MKKVPVTAAWLMRVGFDENINFSKLSKSTGDLGFDYWLCIDPLVDGDGAFSIYDQEEGTVIYLNYPTYTYEVENMWFNLTGQKLLESEIAPNVRASSIE